MKNGKRVTEYLDYHAETMRLLRSGTAEAMQAAGERVGETSAMWEACLDDGWTRAELDAAFERRFHFRTERS